MECSNAFFGIPINPVGHNRSSRRFPTWSLPFFSCCQTQRPSLYDHYDGADSPQPSAAPEPATPRTRTTAPRPALLYSPATPARHMPTACSPRPVGSGEARAEPAPCDSDDESSPLTGGMSLCQENDREESAAETGIAPAEVELTEADRREPVRGSPGRVPSGIVARRLAEMGPPELLRPVAPGQMSGNEEAQIFLAKPATRVR